MLRATLYIAIILGAIGLTSQRGVAAESLFDQTRDHLRLRIEEGSEGQHFTCRGELICGSSAIPIFYEGRDYRPVWYAEKGLMPQAYSLVSAVHQAHLEGLRPEDYHLANIESLLADVLVSHSNASLPNPETLADLDLLLTDTFLMYSSHLLAGRVNPETIHPKWVALERTEDLLEMLLVGLRSEEFGKLVIGLRPPHSGYEKLQKALIQYREISAKGGWPELPSGSAVRKGDKDGRVMFLRHRLAISGDLHPAFDNGDDLFDDQLDLAVRLFQERHGLTADGTVGRRTREALNTSVEDRIRQIELNMERWRWLPHELGERYILVNAANFHLEVIEDDRVLQKMRAVVGKFYRRTPVFTAKMTYLVFNPFWNIPPRIARVDILPKIKEAPDYFAKRKIRVFENWQEGAEEIPPESIEWSKISNFPYKLRQDPGPLNALGRVKFMFPNPFKVYIHDTPNRELFIRPRRGFSSGCIRIERPIELTEYLLSEDSEWTREKIMASIDSGLRQVVRLKNPIPVHLLYWTAWADDNGDLHFREDIYERDAPLDEALREKPPLADPIPVRSLQQE